MTLLSESDRSALLERFLRYVKICTTSDSTKADEGLQPSTQDQWQLAQILMEELSSLGLKKLQKTQHCYVYGFLPGTPGLENSPSIALLAHMDTSEEVSGKNVSPQIHKNYSGEKIVLDSGITLDPAEDKYLSQAAASHETVITSDGTTLLGADDKAGIAAIISALSYFNDHPEIPHVPVEVIFSPDEETGHGMDNVPLNLIKSKCAYTVDGGHAGELECECFNAFKSEITFTGVATHTGSARGKLVNAVTMASAFIASLPRHEAPETTDGYEGFYAPMNIEGSIESAKVTLFLRDFTAEGMEKRRAITETLARSTALSFGGKAETVHTQQYLNMKRRISEAPGVVERLINAYNKSGVPVVMTPIRGGTDGSRLTEEGIPTPNIFTGGHNYHSRTEWASLEQMTRCTEVLINLCSNDIQK